MQHDAINPRRRRLLGAAAATIAASRLDLGGQAHAEAAPVPGASVFPAPLKQVDAGVLSVGYLDAGVPSGPAGTSSLPTPVPGKPLENDMSQRWLITGSSRGIGRALAEAVLHSGHRLVATARDPAQLADLAKRYEEAARLVALDVTDPSAAQAAVRTAVEAFDGLDVLVNNAGYGNVNSVEDTDLDEFRRQIETNLFGTIIMTKAAIPVLRAQRRGHIIQFSSVGGRIGAPGRAAYSAAKWGIEGFTEVLAREMALIGVKVTMIEPGADRFGTLNLAALPPAHALGLSCRAG
jgi:NAD(P)-dependent dehydrogenase (short-subunit alcohol dehydrogenase family)